MACDHSLWHVEKNEVAILLMENRLRKSVDALKNRSSYKVECFNELERELKKAESVPNFPVFVSEFVQKTLQEFRPLYELLIFDGEEEFILAGAIRRLRISLSSIPFVISKRFSLPGSS